LLTFLLSFLFDTKNVMAIMSQYICNCVCCVQVIIMPANINK
jgi:hypothetical protein